MIQQPSPRPPGRLLAAQVAVVLAGLAVLARLGDRVRRDERGDAYSSTIMVAIGVVTAITVGGILLYKFQAKANSIDTNTPVGTPPPTSVP